ncbi:MAG: phosphate acetyltransferase [Balneolaceae bacterium]|nr:phosphate acetyltransferase [Balneolaceae bacterium]
MSLLQIIREKASGQKKTIILPEAEKDIRVIRAALELQKNGLAEPVLLGSREVILKLATDHNETVPDEVVITPYADNATEDEKYEFFKEKLKHKNLDKSQLLELCNNPLFTAGWMLATGRGDAAVAGSVASTGEVIVSALRTVGVAPGSGLVSSTFLMEMPDGRVFTYADCAVVPYPDSEQLASIAVDAGHTHRLLAGEEPVVAFLSFSTKGSARHERVELVQKAAELAKTKQPDWKMDGELQFDTAAIADIAARKAPDSPVKGSANVFIFPNLDAGNIAYKITERLGGATATGPILQGLAKPYMDLSRGCSVEDIVNTACVASLLANES